MCETLYGYAMTAFDYFAHLTYAQTAHRSGNPVKPLALKPEQPAKIARNTYKSLSSSIIGAPPYPERVTFVLTSPFPYAPHFSYAKPSKLVACSNETVKMVG